MNKATEQAKHLSQFAHAGQTYGTHPYIYHLEGVVRKAIEFADAVDIGIETIKQVAYLHDILEDTNTTEEFLRAHFSRKVVDAVCLLTKRPSVPYDDYISAIKTNRLALIVKVADTLFNLERSVMSGNQKRVVKYTNQLVRLTI